MPLTALFIYPHNANLLSPTRPTCVPSQKKRGKSLGWWDMAFASWDIAFGYLAKSFGLFGGL